MENQEVRNLAPSEVWNNFADLNTIPRGSYNTAKVVQYMIDLAESLGLEYIKDEVGNLVIKKPATKGMENRKKVVLQGHLDMVCQKNNDVVHDFETEGIKMYIDGDWVKAKGTTLGADNGTGVACIIAILKSKTIEHPDIEALFTIDEEVGMVGAKHLKEGFITGDYLINIDSGTWGLFAIGCAGAVNIVAKNSYNQIDNTNDVGLKVYVKGLIGGHSGKEINKGLANSNKILSRFLYDYIKYDYTLSEIDGGGLRNAIPRESFAIFSVNRLHLDSLKADFEKLRSAIIDEYSNIEKDMQITLEEVENPSKVIDAESSKNIAFAILGAHDGVYRMSTEIKDLVEGSNNIARVELKDGELGVLCMTRSSVESLKLLIANSVKVVFELAGLNVEFTGAYPGWKPNPNSDLVKVSVEQYEKLFGEKPRVAITPSGLEPGVIGSKYPKIEMLAFGPMILSCHSPEERVDIPSVGRLWDLVLGIMKNIPAK